MKTNHVPRLLAAAFAAAILAAATGCPNPINDQTFRQMTDRNPPTVDLASPAGGASYTQTVVVQGTAIDGEGRLKGIAWTVTGALGLLDKGELRRPASVPTAPSASRSARSRSRGPSGHGRGNRLERQRRSGDRHAERAQRSALVVHGNAGQQAGEPRLGRGERCRVHGLLHHQRHHPHDERPQRRAVLASVRSLRPGERRLVHVPAARAPRPPGTDYWSRVRELTCNQVTGSGLSSTLQL